jgi:hypothetical protein
LTQQQHLHTIPAWSFRRVFKQWSLKITVAILVHHAKHRCLIRSSYVTVLFYSLPAVFFLISTRSSSNREAVKNMCFSFVLSVRLFQNSSITNKFNRLTSADKHGWSPPCNGWSTQWFIKAKVPG